MKKKFLIFPDWVDFSRDGDKYFVTFERLIRLYKLPFQACVNATVRGNEELYKHIIHLGPQENGNYDLPKEYRVCE